MLVRMKIGKVEWEEVSHARDWRSSADLPYNSSLLLKQSKVKNQWEIIFNLEVRPGEPREVRLFKKGFENLEPYFQKLSENR